MNTWISYTVFELWDKEFNVKKIIAVKDATFAVAKRKPGKKFRLVRNSNPWPLRYRCSALTNWANKPTGSWSFSRSVINLWRMKMKQWICEYHIFELWDKEFNVKEIMAVIESTFVVAKRKPEKKTQCRLVPEPTKWTKLNDQLPVGLLAQLGRALHRYRRGQGFESRTKLSFRNCKVASITAMILFTLNDLSLFFKFYSVKSGWIAISPPSSPPPPRCL